MKSFNSSKEDRCTRFSYVGKIKSKVNVKSFHDTLSSEREFTGACITINHTYFVGVLEFAREETLQDYVQALRRRNFFETTRVLSIVENVPKEFLFYFSREATMQSDESQ